MRIRSWAAAIVAVCALSLSSADAAIITTSSVTLTGTDIGQTFTTTYNGSTAAPAVQSGLSAEIEYTFLGFTGNTASFSAEITNTSSAPITASRVSSFGFDTDPTVLSGTTNGDTTFSNVLVNGAFPNQFGAIDVCVTGGTTCQGGSSTGVLIGQTYTVDLLTLTFSSTLNQLVLTNFGVRYQSIDSTTGLNGASGTGYGCVGSTCTPPPPPPPPPEPTSMALLGIGLIGAAVKLRRRF